MINSRKNDDEEHCSLKLFDFSFTHFNMKYLLVPSSDEDSDVEEDDQVRPASTSSQTKNISVSGSPIPANSGQLEAINMPRLDQRNSPDHAEDALDETSV